VLEVDPLLEMTSDDWAEFGKFFLEDCQKDLKEYSPQLKCFGIEFPCEVRI
jgi:hypothetical protein